MTPQTQKMRMALAAYDGGETLWPTVAKLIHTGVSAEQIGIAARPETLSMLAKPMSISADEWQRLAPILERVEPIATSAGGVSIAGTREPHYYPWAVEDTGKSDRASASLRFDLERQISDGATVLWVICASSEQQWLCARVLLEQSAYPVRTYEFGGRTPD